MKREFVWVIVAIILAGLAIVLVLLYIIRPKPIDFSYDPSPQNVVISTDMRFYPGGLRPEDPACLADFFPNLRVWGDGMVFYQSWEFAQPQSTYYSGQLTPDQIHALLVFLSSQGYFSAWTPESPNPAGTTLDIGVRLNKQNVEYQIAELHPVFYMQLIEQIMPQLQVIDQQMTDARVNSLIAKIRSCALATMPTPSTGTNHPYPYPYPNANQGIQAYPPASTPAPPDLPHPYPYPYESPTPTATFTPTPTIIPVKTEILYSDLAIVWRECNIPFGDWQGGADCLGINLPDFTEADRALFGERNNWTGAITQTIGSDIYVSRYTTSHANQEDYALLKNGEVITTVTGTQWAYDPNQALLNVGGKIAWEFADYGKETVIYDGKDLLKEYGLDAAYRPYALEDKLIFTARQGEKYFVMYDGQKIGPDFDKIMVAYCCEPVLWSIRRLSREYWFLGDRDGQHYAVVISSVK